MHVYRPYPKWKYHADKEARVVDSAEAEGALGEGWVDSPADVQVIDREFDELEETLRQAETKLHAMKRPGRKSRS